MPLNTMVEGLKRAIVLAQESRQYELDTAATLFDSDAKNELKYAAARMADLITDMQNEIAILEKFETDQNKRAEEYYAAQGLGTVEPLECTVPPAL